MSASLNVAEAKKVLMAYINSGAIGPTTGTFTTYSVVEETPTKITFMATLMSFEMLDSVPLNRYVVKIDRYSGSVLSSELASITSVELEAMFTDAGIGHVDAVERFKDGSFSVSYKALCKPNSYVVQLRSNGNIGTIYAIHQLINQKCPTAIPVPQVFKTSVMPSCNLPVQISAFVSGVMASVVYPNLALEQKMRLLKRIARVFDAVWSLIPLPADSQIGEAIIDPETHTLSVGPDRRCQIGGPFSSVSSYLESWIRRRVLMLQEQEDVDEYKSKYLDRILQFTATLPSSIPDIVHQVPVVISHADMGLHNMILDSSAQHDLKAVIDWEFVYCYPFPFSVVQLIEPMFFGDSETEAASYLDLAETLRAAFWNEIPTWRDLLRQESCQVFLDFFNFGLSLKVEALRGEVDVEEKWQSWDRSCRMVDSFLDKYGTSSSNL